MYEGYAVYGTTELINNLRTWNYQMRGCINDGTVMMNKPECEHLPLIVSAPAFDYTTPEADSAPWYDASFPESGDFAGFWCESIIGFDSLGQRSVDATAFGSIASRRKLTPKTLTVTGWISGKTCCATQYGYRWLVSKLMERDCDTGEEVSQLSIYDCCPPLEDVLELTDEQIMEEYLRIGYRVKVTSDPVILDRTGTCCDSCGATNLYVQWTFTLENPRLYKNVELALEQEPWPEEITCVDFECDPCPEEETVEVRVRRPKTRLPVAINADGTYCPIGWEIDPLNFPPENSWFDVADFQVNLEPLQVFVSYNGTWTANGWDPTTVDLASVQIAIAKACSNTGVSATLPAECTDTGAEKRTLPIELTVTSSTGGTWSEVGWTFDPLGPLPPNFSELSIYTGDNCDTSSSDEGEINLNSDGTWTPWNFPFTGQLPPIGFSKLTVRRNYPGTYIATETLPVSEAFSATRGLTSPTPYAQVSPSYCQPLEWVQLCSKIEFTSGIERAEPYVEFYSGSSSLHNFKVEFYTLQSADDLCICDELTEEELAEWNCRTPEQAIRFGESIPADSTVVYDPRDMSIRIHYGTGTYDASSLASGVNGGTPYFIELPDCYGVCVLATAEVYGGSLPASDAYVSVGHIPSYYVGV